MAIEQENGGDRDELLAALLELRRDLSQKSFDPGVQRVIAARDLLVAMAAKGGPTDPLEWEGWLAPLFCASQSQQEQFHELFTRWMVRHRNLFVGRSRLEPVPDVRGEERRRESSPDSRERRRGERAGGVSPRGRRGLLVGGSLLLLLTIGGGLWLRQTQAITIRGTITDRQGGQPLTTATVRVSGGAERAVDQRGNYELVFPVSNLRLIRGLTLELTATAQGYANQTTRRALERWGRAERQIEIDFSLVASPPSTAPGGSMPPNSTSPSSPPSMEMEVRKREVPLVERAPTGWEWLLILSPILLWLVWQILTVILRTWWLERVSRGVPPDLRRLPIADPALELFASPREQRLLIELRRPRPLDLQDLNLPATVRETARRAGIFTPSFQALRTSPEYLLLIDSVSVHDEQARVGEGLLASLQSVGVYVEPFSFQGDPRLCRSLKRSDENRPGVSLRALASRYPESRLLLFSDAEGFYDRFTGQPRPWLGQLDAWSERALLTPKPPDRWGYREEALAERQFRLLPVNFDGLRQLGEWLNYGQPPQPERGSTPPYPPSLADRPGRWLDRQEPDLPAVERMLGEVRGYLGEDGYLWLCACAVYPAIVWELTLCQGFWLFAERPDWSENRAALTLPLVRLPWFRHGYLPEWLRIRLIQHLSRPELREKRNLIRDQLEQLLLTAAKNPAKVVALEIAIPKRTGLRERLQQALRRAAMVLHLTTRDEREVLRDYVFLRFMTGRQVHPHGVRLPDLVERLFFRDGRRWLGVRPYAILLLSILLSGALAWWGTDPALRAEGGAVPEFPRTATPTGFVFQLADGVTLELVSLPGGRFAMGAEGYEHQKPVHQVTVAPLWMGRTEVTQAQWRAVTGSLPKVRFPGDERPVERVSWRDAKEFCRQLSAKTGYEFRLPTEAEWEYAARGGTTTEYSFGDDASELGRYAWFYGNPDSETHPVAKKLPNPFGLYDMHGNVWEWVEDHWHKNYQGAPTDGSAWLTEDDSAPRVVRGGSWYNDDDLRSAIRLNDLPDNRSSDFGFRVVVGAQTRPAR